VAGKRGLGTKTGGEPVFAFHCAGRDAGRKNVTNYLIMTSLRRNNTHWTLRLILVTAPLAFVCIAVVAAMQGIRLAPAAPTFRQDQAELARLESKSDAHIADLRIAEARTDVDRPMTPSPAVEESATAVSEPPKEDSPLKPAQSKAVATRGHGSRTSHSKRYQAELAFQRQRAVTAGQYRYAQQESGSFFSSIARALGFSGR
jgi:hypothetical protein